MNSERFQTGYDIPTYVKNLRNYRSLVRELLKDAEPEKDAVDAVAAATTAFHAPVRVTMMTEDWCGDSAANTPILARLFENAELEFRVFRGSETPDLKKFYADDGATHIPVVSFWDGDGRELARWIEAPAAVRKRKDAWKNEHPEFMELYRIQEKDKDAARRFQVLYREFLQTMAGWYRDEGLWSETTREIVSALENAAEE